MQTDEKIKSLNPAGARDGTARMRRVLSRKQPCGAQRPHVIRDFSPFPATFRPDRATGRPLLLAIIHRARTL